MSRFRMYDFNCKNCEAKFEYTVDSQVAEKVRCPYCDSGNVERVLSPIGYTGDTGSASVRPKGIFKRRAK